MKMIKIKIKRIFFLGLFIFNPFFNISNLEANNKKANQIKTVGAASLSAVYFTFAVGALLTFFTGINDDFKGGAMGYTDLAKRLLNTTLLRLAATYSFGMTSKALFELTKKIRNQNKVGSQSSIDAEDKNNESLNEEDIDIVLLKTLFHAWIIYSTSLLLCKSVGYYSYAYRNFTEDSFTKSDANRSALVLGPLFIASHSYNCANSIKWIYNKAKEMMKKEDDNFLI